MTVRILLALLLASATATAQSAVVIRSQGARPFGGKVVGDAANGSIHCDHGYVEWQVPENARRVPLVMVHARST
jgi:hypothetical protein